jgi:hypothetical protein
MEVYWVILAGVFGGCCLEIYRVYKIIQNGGEFSYPKRMLIISLLLALVGGGLAGLFYLTDPINPITAFWIGLSAPTILEKFLSTNPVSTNIPGET